MIHNNIARTSLIILVVFLFISSVLSSCKPVTNTTEPGNGFLITATPITPSPTKRICNPNNVYTISTPPQYSPILLVVLFNPNLDNNLQYRDGKSTSNPLEFIQNALPNILFSGDQYAIFELGYKSYEAAQLGRDSFPRINEPPSRAMFQGQATLTTIPTTTKTLEGLQEMQRQGQYDATVTAQIATVTEMAFIDRCEKEKFVNEAYATETAWSATQTLVGNEIATQASGIENDHPLLETPYSQDVVYEGLSHATIVFNNLCDKFSRCVLLIISDMKDYRAGFKGMIQDGNIDLTNVEIITVMPNCEDIFQPSCTDLENIWRNEFLLANAKTVYPLMNGDNLESYLIDKLRGDR